jgi:hypothetical protein
LNEKIVADSKESVWDSGKTILQFATEFGLMKLVKSSITEFNGIEIEKPFREFWWKDSDPEMSFLGIACRTGNVETIKWIVSCMKRRPTGKKDLESQEEPLLQAGYDIFLKGIGLENEIPPISAATNPVLDFLLDEVDDEKWTDYRYQNTNETVAHLIAREGGSIGNLQKLPKETLTEPNKKGKYNVHTAVPRLT